MQPSKGENYFLLIYIFLCRKIPKVWKIIDHIEYESKIVPFLRIPRANAQAVPHRIEKLFTL